MMHNGPPFFPVLLVTMGVNNQEEKDDQAAGQQEKYNRIILPNVSDEFRNLPNHPLVNYTTLAKSKVFRRRCLRKVTLARQMDCP